MDHAVTASDVLIVVLATGSVVTVLVVLVAILNALAQGMSR